MALGTKNDGHCNFILVVALMMLYDDVACWDWSGEVAPDNDDLKLINK